MAVSSITSAERKMQNTQLEFDHSLIKYKMPARYMATIQDVLSHTVLDVCRRH